MNKLIAAFFLGVAGHALAQTVVSVAPPAYIQVVKNSVLNLVAADRLVIAVNPASFTMPGGHVALVDYTVPGGKALAGTISLFGKVQ